MDKCTYAYGDSIIYALKGESLCKDSIYVFEDNFSIEGFPFKVPFETNQRRELELLARFDFREEKKLNEWIFTVEDVITFLCDSKKQTICYIKQENCTDDLMHFWLIHYILPIYNSLNTKYYFLHTGSVIVYDKPVLFIGNSHAGKSTLTGHFLKKKHTLLSDDKMATFFENDAFYCNSSHHFHRPYRKLEDLGIKSDSFYVGKLEMQTLYWITPVTKDEPVHIELLKGLQKFEKLRYATEMDIYVNQESRFAYITKLANTLKIYEIKIPRDLERLDEVYEKILDHQEKIEG